MLNGRHTCYRKQLFLEKFVSRLASPGLAFHQIKGSMRDCSWLGLAILSIVISPLPPLSLPLSLLLITILPGIATTDWPSLNLALSHMMDVNIEKIFTIPPSISWMLLEASSSHTSNFMPHHRGHFGKSTIVPVQGCDFTSLRHSFIIPISGVNNVNRLPGIHVLFLENVCPIVSIQSKWGRPS